jgi:hypothetical protein
MADLTTRERATLQVVERQAKARESLLLALIKALLGLWGPFNGWDDRDLVTGHAARSAVLVELTLARARRQSRAYAESVLRQADALPERDLAPIDDVYPRSGVGPVEVYERVANQFLYDRKTGVDEATAREHVAERLEKLARMDVQLADRDTTAETFRQSSKVIGKRRILHPELSESGFSCGLCVVAASRLYGPDDLKEVHDGCNCEETVVTAGFDPGLRLNREDLDKVYAAAGGNSADFLRDVSIRIDEHGELGPVLRNADHDFRGPADASTERRRFTPFEPTTPAQQRQMMRESVARSQRAVQRIQDAIARGDGETTIGQYGREQKVSDFEAALGFHQSLIQRYSSLI